MIVLIWLFPSTSFPWQVKRERNVCRRLQRVLLWEVQRLAVVRLQRRMPQVRVLQVGTSLPLQELSRLQTVLRLSSPSMCPRVQQLLWSPISSRQEGNIIQVVAFVSVVIVVFLVLLCEVNSRITSIIISDENVPSPGWNMCSMQYDIQSYFTTCLTY